MADADTEYDSGGRVIAAPFTGTVRDLVTHLVLFHGIAPDFATIGDTDAQRYFRQYGTRLTTDSARQAAEERACELATIDRCQRLHQESHFQAGLGRTPLPVPHWHATPKG